ncbi:MAG TPA: hypothetical protein VGK53_23080 [Propionicimonas sp.]|jgi:uncharacterized membrane protein
MSYPKPERSAAPTITGILMLVIGYVLTRFSGIPGMTVTGLLLALAGLITVLVGISMVLNNLDNLAANHWDAAQSAAATGPAREPDQG